MVRLMKGCLKLIHQDDKSVNCFREMVAIHQHGFDGGEGWI